MLTRFQTALHRAVDELTARGDVEGILLFGSALEGTAGPTSDLDLYVILAGQQERSQITLRRVAGVEAEIHLGTEPFWRRLVEGGRAVPIHAFAAGQAVVDKNGVVSGLIDLAKRKVEEGPLALTQHEIDVWRYRLSDLAGDLEDVAGQPADERMLGARLVTLSLEAYCALNRLWGDKPKRLINYVDRHDPGLGRMARHFFAGDLDRHLAQTIVDRVLAPHGGRIGQWDGPVRETT